MIFTCPQCGARMRGTRPGSVLACSACANPVVVPHEEPESEEAAAPEAEPPPAEASSPPRGPMATAVIVVLIVAAGHVAFYLLLTLDARAEIRRLEIEHGADALLAARQPEVSGAPGTPAYRTWRRAHDLWVASEAYDRHLSHVGLLRKGFVFSFLVQLAITGWILLRVLETRKRMLSRDAA